MRTLKKLMFLSPVGLLTGVAAAQDESAASAYDTFMETPGADMFTVNNLWIMLAAALVFIMHLGFATLESGLTQRKNTVNILFKNVWIISIGLLTYYFCGFLFHYPGEWIIDGFLGKPGIVKIESEADFTSAYNAGYTKWTDFLFQGMFAATAATIVSGAVAERIKLTSFMIYSTILVAVGYTVAGSWHWGTGFLSRLGEDGDAAFYDFAGSTVVHGFGGAAALAAVLVLGPRKGKYTANGIKPILGHSMPLAAIGVFLLWLGWFGFNGGSVLSADPKGTSTVLVTTSLAAAAGAVGSIFTAMLILRKPDLSMALNGILAGLVAITAGADAISPTLAILTGFIGGIVVVFSILFFDKVKIDDPVGAISVHGVIGIWGTLAVALFSDAAPLLSQIIGVVSVYGFAFIFSFALFFILKLIMGVRVSEDEESEGLDVAEHGAPAYHD
jgi:Amt family ammonium transporter